MLNNMKGREDSTAVRVWSEKILDYWAEPSEELESRDSSPLSHGARSVMVRWAHCLGGGASRGSTGALMVWGGALLCWATDRRRPSLGFSEIHAVLPLSR